MKIRNLVSFKTLLACSLSFIALLGNAQDKTKTIGNKSRSGTTNNSFNIVQGGQVGIKMNAGRKPVELLKLTFHVDNLGKDTIPFKVNVYTMGDKLPEDDNLIKEEIKGSIVRENGPNTPLISNQLISVDLSTYKIGVKGEIVVSVEFLRTILGKNLGFSCGLLNGGTYYKKGPDAEWKKMPIIGADFNVLVKKLKQD
ncbi:hypothetical protein SNE25_17915 [Mucilaginibacter sabulilitoris]|uniref:Uncharacterized protein n=1 Tax=Mucilaginibacter sabulilitoris TaxID=1173583 RepID=A0ABZ0TDA9_9SPHI|nr:hypothetical protein [Mucilaginibacter sabulilitoris]WPU91196.1 hypothetical protein SNE25_17915 [Mucilaginibacter sabulilitoris]